LNYQQLQALYSKHASAGFRVMAFPCNQFGAQEPGSNESIQRFASDRFGVSFDMYQKVKVNGDDAAPLWKFLKKSQPGALSFIKWNFTKFLIDRNGVPIQRFGPKDNPVAIERHIVAALST